MHVIVFIWDFNTVAWWNSEPVKQKKKGEESDHSVSEGDVNNVAQEEEEVEEEEEEEKEKVSKQKESKKRRLLSLISCLILFCVGFLFCWPCHCFHYFFSILLCMFNIWKLDILTWSPCRDVIMIYSLLICITRQKQSSWRFKTLTSKSDHWIHLLSIYFIRITPVELLLVIVWVSPDFSCSRPKKKRKGRSITVYLYNDMYWVHSNLLDIYKTLYGCQGDIYLVPRWGWCLFFLI